MIFPGTNLRGAAAFAGAFGAAIAMGKLAAFEEEGPLTVVGGLLVVLIHFLFIFLSEPPTAAEAEQNKQPKILFMPAWWIGVFWIGIGVYDSIALRV